MKSKTICLVIALAVIFPAYILSSTNGNSASVAEKARPAQAAAPGEARVVRTAGSAVMPIERNRVSLARQAAFTLAKRDAVERALGTVVDLIAAPDEKRRSVTASLQGKVRNVEVITDERRGDLYVVQIEADVVIPPGLEKELPPAPAPETTGFPPAVQPFPKGKVNWEQGYLEAVGTGEIPNDRPDAREMAKRAARVDAYAVAMEIVKGINYDPDSEMGDILKKRKQREYRIRGLVQGAQVVHSEKKEGVFKVTVRVPLWGLKGVTIAFRDIFPEMPAPKPGKRRPKEEPGKEKESEPEKNEDEYKARTYTGLLVDARGTGVNPALFPVIADEDNNVVYGAGMVAAQALSRHGAAAYATKKSENPKGAGLGPNPLRIKALTMPPGRKITVASLGSAAWASLFAPSNPLFLLRAEARVTLRQGDAPLEVKAEDSTGAKKAGIIISGPAARLIRTTDARSNYLSEARVVILVDSMVGATEGRVPPENDGRLAWKNGASF